MTARHALLGALAFVAWLGDGGTPARAQPSPDTCFAVPVEGQRLRKDGRLLEARDRFAICSRKTCPAEIVRACVRWTSELDTAIPSVVFAARDSQGRDLTDVRVSIDGKPPVDLSPLAISLDPGTHRFSFQRAGASNVNHQVVLHEGEKNREVLAEFAPRVTAPSDLAGAGQSTRLTPTASEDHTIPTVTWMLAGTGGLALISFATFGVMGLSARSSGHCDTGCSPSQYDRVETNFRIADVSLGVGVIALGASAILYLTRPTAAKRSATASLWLDVHPAPGAAAATVGGVF